MKQIDRRKVQVLPDHIANKIAAGEVIQRPESVVKELLENALDAEARTVLVHIRDGGKKLVQVVDDGMGMDEEDARSSFLRHATSKIVEYEDLEDIRTYGFRGEALASIAAVAQVTMKTRRQEQELAVVVQVDGGGTMRVSREAREVGTTVTVQNLFHNVPARRKFLKTTNTEFRHVYDAVQRVALSRPELSLQFISDEETILDLRPASVQDRAVDIFGERQVGGLIWFEERSDLLALYGYIGKPTFGQKSRVNQYLFLNRRFIINRNVNHAVYSAYENLLIKGSFPFFILFLDIDAHRVDINVHPSKLEAKFEDEQGIYRFVSTVVRKVLASKEFVPGLSVSTFGAHSPGLNLSFTARQHTWPAAPGPGTGEGSPIMPEPDILRRRESTPGPTTSGSEIARQLLLSPDEKQALEKRPQYSHLWQLHEKYILVPIEKGIMVIDQHVAHERVIYERTLKQFADGGPSPQQVLFPHTVELTPGDYSLVIELLPHFEQLGFGIKPFGKNTIVVEGVPSDLRTAFSENLLTDILMLYKEYHQETPINVRDNMAKSYSCKAAIKSGDWLSEQEMRLLVDQLFLTSMPYVCPHGRPVVLRISLEEFDRRFGRT